LRRAGSVRGDGCSVGGDVVHGDRWPLVGDVGSDLVGDVGSDLVGDVGSDLVGDVGGDLVHGDRCSLVGDLVPAVVRSDRRRCLVAHVVPGVVDRQVPGGGGDVIGVRPWPGTELVRVHALVVVSLFRHAVVLLPRSSSSGHADLAGQPLTTQPTGRRAGAGTVQAPPKTLSTSLPNRKSSTDTKVITPSTNTSTTVK